MKKFSTLALPPRMLNRDDAARRVGVELEFAALSARDGANHVQAVFGGRIREEDPHRFHITDTAVGDFVCELDNHFVHRSIDGTEAPLSTTPIEQLLEQFQLDMRSLFGDVASLFIPCEVVCPPISISELDCLETLVDALNAAGATGTRRSPIYSFGAQLNPEIAAGDDDWIIDVFKAYLLLSEWLRAIIAVDLTRRLIAFAEPFSKDYVSQVVDPHYRPTFDTFMDDYLIANPTRNRELDLLPLFAWRDKARVSRAIDDSLVKARPTFHYRLPDANIDHQDWGVLLEWSRWCVVERLAERRALIDQMSTAYLDNNKRLIPENWALRATEFLLLNDV